MTLGDKMKQLRSKENMTQGELAEKIYVSRQTISNWENDKSYPSMDFIVSISEVFSIPIDELVKEDVELHSEEQSYLREVKAKEEMELQQETIRKNKDRVVFNRLLLFRFLLLWLGSFTTAYFLASQRYMEYILIPISFLLVGLTFTLPIKIIRKKYHLKSRQDITNFLDELYK